MSPSPQDPKKEADFLEQVTENIQHGISANKHQFGLHLLQIFLVGLTIGMTRVVLPGLAQTEFGLAENAFFLLASFVVVFGIVKAIMNLFAGKLSDQHGRKTVLIWGWLVALPIPFILLYAPDWNWIIAATVLLGFNQGLCWSMALNSKLDLAKATQKGLVNGINEFSGYAAVGLAGVVTAYFVELWGARDGLFLFSLTIITTGLILAKLTIVETLPWAELHVSHTQSDLSHAPLSLGQLFKIASLENKQLVALNQAGLVEKFTDAIIWIFLPVFLLSKNLTLVQSGAIISVYGMIWGGGQLITGPLSDRIGRKPLIVWGMGLCGLGVLLIPYTDTALLWTLEAGAIGIGMAMLYPNLGAAVGDVAPVRHRASIIGIYRFWRDSGYAFGALVMGLIAQWGDNLVLPFWFVGIAMMLSGGYVSVALKSKN